MVVVKIELWPKGDESKARQIGEVQIINDGTGDLVNGNYKVNVKHGGSYFGKPGNYKSGRVTKFRRLLSPYHLVQRALNSALGRRGN